MDYNLLEAYAKHGVQAVIDNLEDRELARILQTALMVSWQKSKTCHYEKGYETYEPVQYN